MILFSDGDRTYAVYNYNGTSLPLDGARDIFIGYTAENSSFHTPLSGSPDGVKIFDQIGNTGEKGIWVFPLFNESKPLPTNAATCRKWKNIELSKDVPKLSCPCNYNQALLDKTMAMDSSSSCADLVSPTKEGYGMVSTYI